jgi:Rho family, other
MSMIFMSMENTSFYPFGTPQVRSVSTKLIKGQEEFDRLRSLSYTDTHVIMLCFSVASPDSLENVQEKWYEEIAKHCEGTCPPCSTYIGVKIALVALKCDLREDDATKERLARYGEKCISYEEGLAVAKRIRATRYLGTFPLPPKHIDVESSAKNNRGVLEAFTEAARVSLTAKPIGGDIPTPETKKDKSCVII